MVQFLVTTLSSAAVYGLIAISLNVVYRSSGVLNFGAGHLAVFAGILYANEFAGSPAGALLVVAGAAVLGLVGYLISIRTGERMGIPHVALSLAMLGFGLILEFLAGRLWAKQAFTADPLVAESMRLGDTTFARERLVAVLLASLFAVFVVVVIERTMIGHALEATAADPELAMLYGVRTGLVGPATWLIAGAALGLAGVLQSSIAAISAQSALPLVILGIVAAVIGGLGSFTRAGAGALVTAAAQTGFVQFVSPRYSISLVFILLLVVLALRPAGLFSNARAAERV